MKRCSVSNRPHSELYGKMFLLICLVLCTGTMSGQNRLPTSKANFDLILQGPFVICEDEKDASSLLILTPDPHGIKTEHEDAALLTDFTEFRFLKDSVNYELKGDLRPGSMVFQNPEKISLVQVAGKCQQDNSRKLYYWSLRVPKPDEMYLTWPQSVNMGTVAGGQCVTVAKKTYSNRLVFRYLGVDVSKQFQVTDGTTLTDLKVLQIGNEVEITFEMPPIGEHPNHDPDAYEAMAKIAGINSCITLTAVRNNKNGHTDCHAPLIYLCSDCTQKAPSKVATH